MESLAVAPVSPEPFLQLGIAGASLFCMLMIVLAFLKFLKGSTTEWRKSFETHSQASDERQKETNTVLRQLTSVISELREHNRMLREFTGASNFNLEKFSDGEASPEEGKELDNDEQPS